MSKGQPSARTQSDSHSRPALADLREKLAAERKHISENPSDLQQTYRDARGQVDRLGLEVEKYGQKFQDLYRIAPTLKDYLDAVGEQAIQGDEIVIDPYTGGETTRVFQIDSGLDAGDRRALTEAKALMHPYSIAKERRDLWVEHQKFLQVVAAEQGVSLDADKEGVEYGDPAGTVLPKPPQAGVDEGQLQTVVRKQGKELCIAVSYQKAGQRDLGRLARMLKNKAHIQYSGGKYSDPLSWHTNDPHGFKNHIYYLRKKARDTRSWDLIPDNYYRSYT